MKNKTLKSQRPHIGIFGPRNAGKSSFINALTGQEVSIVSETPGTTTDPVDKTLELHGVGPVVLIDTAGFDDEGSLGEKRKEATLKTLLKIDLGIIIFNSLPLSQHEQQFIEEIKKMNLPHILVHSKNDLAQLSPEEKNFQEKIQNEKIYSVSSLQKNGFSQVLNAIKEKLPPSTFQSPSILSDLIQNGDIVILVTPIDNSAPQGRLILPQVQAIRDILDQDAIAIVVKERELDTFLQQTKIEPKLVITDSQAFMKVAASLPQQTSLTSFSILFARLKGDFSLYAEGTKAISKLKNNDHILILESCTHHSTGDDIGRVKIPRWLSNFTGKKLHFDIVAGTDSIKSDWKKYALVIQCGGCMLSKTQVMGRLKGAIENNIPISNYGMAIAYCLGIFERALRPFHEKIDSTIEL